VTSRVGPLKHRVEAFVLAGGASSRFGSDKALARVDGKPLLSRALGVIRRLGLTPRVVARDPSAYIGFNDIFVVSERPGLGPLEALRAVLRASTAPTALVLAVDKPRISPGVLRALISRAEESDAPRAVCLEAGGRRHPFPGAYATRGLETLNALAPDGSLGAALDSLEAITLEVPEGVVTNLNRPPGGSRVESSPPRA
jgi:molybdopterin-guanine dinucleotide biosynthesis protein A